MLWLPKWLRDEQAPASEGVSRRTFLFLGAAAGVGLVLPAQSGINASTYAAHYIRINGVEYGVPALGDAPFLQAMRNEMESLIQDIRRFECRAITIDARKAIRREQDRRAARNAARSARHQAWRASTRRDA